MLLFNENLSSRKILIKDQNNVKIPLLTKKNARRKEAQQMDKRKRKVLVMAAVIALMTLFSRSTLAYYTVTGIATNVVTFGSFGMEIQESTAIGTPFPAEGVRVLPGETVSKEVAVRNVCSQPFWLRVQLVKGSDQESLSADDVLQILDLNEVQWTEHQGYYYYNRILNPGETTEKLFTKVKISGAHVDQSNIGAELTLTVKAYAVQSENNPAEHPWEASGWPEG